MTNDNEIEDFGLLRRVQRFLFNEANLLDNWKVMDWMDLVTHDIDYRIPIRTTLENEQYSDQFNPAAFHMIEDFGSLNARMKRLDGGYAFSESPRSRVRRHVTNICVLGRKENDIEVTSNLLFFWARDDLERLVSAERRDILREIDGELRLARRLVLLDHVSLPIPNLTVVL